MLRARRRFAVVFLVFAMSLANSRIARSQDQSITSPISIARSLVIPRPCGDRRPAPGSQRETTSAREADQPDKLCVERALDRSAIGSPWRADIREKENEDAVLEELTAIGERGLIIERVRQEVVEILEGHNRCAAWFVQAEPDAARKFRSLRYAIDESGPQYALKIQNSAGQWLYQQPYVASSIENMWLVPSRMPALVPRSRSMARELSFNSEQAYALSPRMEDREGSAHPSCCISICTLEVRLALRCLHFCMSFRTWLACSPLTAKVSPARNSQHKTPRLCCNIVARKWKEPGSTRDCS